MRVDDGLLGCPFCGEAAGFVHDADNNWFYVSCINCDADGPKHENKQEAVRRWNTRVDKQGPDSKPD